MRVHLFRYKLEQEILALKTRQSELQAALASKQEELDEASFIASYSPPSQGTHKSKYMDKVGDLISPL